jgi:hypothetical protein
VSSNIFSRLARMLPDAPVLVGRVLEHHDDDTSTVELPLETPSTVIGGGVARGSLIRPRGTTVPVGGWAFVRRGVIETRAPDALPLPIEVGEPAAPAFTFLESMGGLAFNDDLGSRPADTGEVYYSAPFTGFRFKNPGVGRVSGTPGAQFDFAPPAGLPFYLEIEGSGLNESGYYFDVWVAGDTTSSFRAWGRFRRHASGLLVLDSSVRNLPDPDVYGGGLYSLDPAGTHVYRIEGSADRLTWTFKADGAVVDVPLVIVSPLAIATAHFGFSSFYEEDMRIYRVQGGIL